MSLFADLRPLARHRDGNLCLMPLPDYSFAARASVLPVHAFELQWLVSVLPVALQPGGDGPPLVGVTGIEAGENLFVGPRGAWTGDAKPDVLETYPLALVPTADGSEAIALDRASDLVSESDGEPLLTEDGQPTAMLVEYRQQLQRQMRDRQASRRAVMALHEAGVLAPWTAAGVDTIDPARHYYVKLADLHQLPAEMLGQMGRSGTLGIAYAQAYSLACMRKLRRMAQGRRKSGPDLGVTVADDDSDAPLDFSNI